MFLADLDLLGDHRNSIKVGNNHTEKGDATEGREIYNMSHYNGSLYDNLSFDALFGSHYDSEKDEDYSMKEDLIQNTKTYKGDHKPFDVSISKAEVAQLKSQLKYDSLLFGDDLLQKHNFNDVGCSGISDYEVNESSIQGSRPDERILRKRRGTRSQIANHLEKRRKIEPNPEESKHEKESALTRMRQGNTLVVISNESAGEANVKGISNSSLSNGIQDSKRQLKQDAKAVETKSIQIQVTPEKLEEEEEAVKGTRGKQKQRRKRQSKKQSQHSQGMQSFNEFFRHASQGGYQVHNPMNQAMYAGMMNSGQYQQMMNSQMHHIMTQYQNPEMYQNSLGVQQIQWMPHMYNQAQMPPNMQHQYMTKKQQEQMSAEYASYMNDQNHQQMVNYGHMVSQQQAAYQGGMANQMNFMQMMLGTQPHGKKHPNSSNKEDNDQRSQGDDLQSDPFAVSELNKELMRNKIRTEYYPFENDQLKELVQQIDMYIQLLYQVLLSDDSAAQSKLQGNQSGPQSKQTHGNSKNGTGNGQSASAKVDQKSKTSAEQEEQLKKRAYCLLYDFIQRKEHVLRNLNLPKYQVPWLRVPNLDATKEEKSQSAALTGDKERNDIRKTEDKNQQSSGANVAKGSQKWSSFITNPQVSYFQCPLLEYAPFVISQIRSNDPAYAPFQNQTDAQSQIQKNISDIGGGHGRYSFCTAQNCFNIMKPLINPNLLPPSLVPDKAPSNSLNCSNLEPQALSFPQNNNRRKFTSYDDNFMILGLQEFGYKNIELISQHWLPRKTPNEIKHRYKNLTCQRVPDNVIKRWKTKQGKPLNERELFLFAQGVKWFGDATNRWTLISKCFLPDRTAQHLKVEFSSIVTDFAKAEQFGSLMLIDIPDKKLLTIANRYFPATMDDSEQDQSSDQKKVTAGSRKAKSSLSPGLLQFDEKRLVSMQHFEQIELDKIDEFLTTEDQEEDPLEVSLLQTRRKQDSPFSKLKQLMALGMAKESDQSDRDGSRSEKTIGDFLQHDDAQAKRADKKPMVDLMQGLKDNYDSSESDSQSEKYQRVEMSQDSDL